MDEIILSTPGGRHLCNSLQHRTMGRLAEVIVTFGRLGTRWPDVLWPDSWGRSFPMCAQCWDATRQVAQKHRPALIIRDTGQPPAAPGYRDG